MKSWIAYLSGLLSLGLSLSACATLQATPTPTPNPTSTPTRIPPSPTAPPSPTEVKSENGTVNQVAWSPDGELLAVAGSEGIYLYRAETLERLTALDSGAVSVAFSPLDGGQTLATAYGETIELWDVSDVLQTGELKLKQKLLSESQVNQITFSPDGQKLAAASEDTLVHLWDMTTGDPLRALEGLTGPVMSVAFSPDGETLAAGAVTDCAANVIFSVWNVETGEILPISSGVPSTVMSVAYNPDGRQFAVGGIYGFLVIDTETQEAMDLGGHTAGITSLAYSPDGKVLASGSEDQTIRLWDVLSSENLHVLEGHTDTVSTMAFSPDGQQLASGSYDGTVQFWDVATGKILRALAVYGGWPQPARECS
jgi:WD40 repeat protein